MKHAEEDCRMCLSVTGDILKTISIAHSAALYLQKNEALSVRGFAKLQTIMTAISNNIRMMAILEDLILDKTNTLPKKSYYNITEFFNAIVNQLNSFFAGDSQASFRFTTKLSPERTFYISASETEHILLAIIYCLVKNLHDTDKKEIKINLSEKIGKDRSYIVTLTSYGTPLLKKYANLVNAENDMTFDFWDINSINLFTLRKNVEELSGSISYQNTKTLNKFVFTFPHINKFEDNEAGEPSDYIADSFYAKCYFYDLILS